MKEQDILTIIISAINGVRESEANPPLPETAFSETASLSELGLDVLSFSELALDLEQRFGSRDLSLAAFMVPETFVNTSLGDLIERIRNKVAPRPVHQGASLVVYVDDEEENLFVFKRKFGKELKIKTFANPYDALKFIADEPDVGVVITDEVMPGMRGNELCDEVKKIKPFMKFILITGNPEHDDRLMYRSLRQNRFYDFIQKPVDFDNKKEQYLEMIRGILDGDVS